MKTLDAVNLFIQSRQSRNLSPQSIRWYRTLLFKFADEYSKIPKKPEQLERFIIKQKVGDERKHAYYRALKCLYRFLKKRKYSKHNPVEYMEEPRVTKKDPQVLMPEQLNRILASTKDPKIKAAIMAYIDTGARLSEISGLGVEDLVETPEGFVVVVNGKTGMRSVPISYETYHALMVNLPFGHKPDWMHHKIKDACEAAGVKATALTFRHTFGTLWDGDELVLQQIMGHSTINTTKRYRHLKTHHLIREHNQHSPLKMVLGASKNLF